MRAIAYWACVLLVSISAATRIVIFALGMLLSNASCSLTSELCRAVLYWKDVYYTPTIRFITYLPSLVNPLSPPFFQFSHERFINLGFAVVIAVLAIHRILASLRRRNLAAPKSFNVVAQILAWVGLSSIVVALFLLFMRVPFGYAFAILPAMYALPIAFLMTELIEAVRSFTSRRASTHTDAETLRTTEGKP